MPAAASEDAVADVRAREAANSRVLAAEGSLLRLWRPPLAPGEWRALGLFSAGGDDELESVLASMPLGVWRTDEVTPLSPHPNDPAPKERGVRASLPEYLTTFTVEMPPDASRATVEEFTAGEAVRTRELAHEGSLVRLWLLPHEMEKTRALGLWRAASSATGVVAVAASYWAL